MENAERLEKTIAVAEQLEREINEGIKREDRIEGRIVRMKDSFVDGALAGAMGLSAFELADDYINGGAAIDSELGLAVVMGGIAGLGMLGTYGLAKEGLGALLGMEEVLEKNYGHSLKDSIKRIGSHALDGAFTGYIGIPLIQGGSDYVLGNNVFDSDLLVASSAGAVGGAVLMGVYGIAKEATNALFSKAKSHLSARDSDASELADTLNTPARAPISARRISEDISSYAQGSSVSEHYPPDYSPIETLKKNALPETRQTHSPDHPQTDMPSTEGINSDALPQASYDDSGNLANYRSDLRHESDADIANAEMLSEIEERFGDPPK